MAAHNHDDLIKWKNGLLNKHGNKCSNKKILVTIAVGLVLVAIYAIYF